MVKPCLYTRNRVRQRQCPAASRNAKESSTLQHLSRAHKGQYSMRRSLDSVGEALQETYLEHDNMLATGGLRVSFGIISGFDIE